MDNILRNARQLAAQGIKEIVLTGVNTGDYGQGLDTGQKFVDVVRQLDALPELSRLRISSIEPNLLTDEIIRYVAGAAHFMPHFHVPLQSGSNELLRLMRRRYQRELYADRVATIKSLMPDACIGVDVIVGFPGETDALFEETYQFLTDLDVSYLHVFPYSERENTHAIHLPDVVPIPERQARSARLRMLSDKKRRHFYRQFVGEVRPVLFEGKKQEDLMHGFTDNYIKVVAPYRADWVNTLQPMRLAAVRTDGLMQAEPELVRI